LIQAGRATPAEATIVVESLAELPEALAAAAEATTRRVDRSTPRITLGRRPSGG
jgi:hypothetical protein